MLTTARFENGQWVINGAKRWIGNRTWCDAAIIWARKEADDKVLGFIIPTNIPGTVQKIEGKYSLRIVQNADITLDDVRLPESLRLQEDKSFKETSKVLRLARLYVAFSAIDNAIGAYDAAAKYASKRQQFGKSIQEFQLVQDLLVNSLANIASAHSLAVASPEAKHLSNGSTVYRHLGARCPRCSRYPANLGKP